MSSVTRFLKQHDASQTYLSAPTTRNTLYEFLPTVAGSTGNYPDGYVQLASSSTTTVNGVTLNTAITNQTAGVAGFILRDMGKTIKARYLNTTGDYSYYRQVQLLAPRGLTAAGAPISATNGVLGEPAYNYFTLYIPVPLAGVMAAPLVSGVSAIVGGEL